MSDRLFGSKNIFEIRYVYNQGLRINKFKINATKVKDNNIAKVALYPPVTSKILLEAVAMKEPPITVNVISAMLVEKYFIPKKVDVKAAVIVGQAP